MRTRLLSLATLLAALTAVGCGDPEIDVDETSKLIGSAVEKQLGADVRSVACPDTVKVQAGATFKCAVTGSDGTKGDANVSQKDDEGNMTFDAPFLNVRKAEQIMQRELSRGSRTATVSCPEIVVAKKDGAFECESTVGTTTGKLAATQIDAAGNFRYREVAR